MRRLRTLCRHLFIHFHFIHFFSLSAFNDMMDLLKLHLTLKWRLFMLIYEFIPLCLPSTSCLAFYSLTTHSTAVFIIAITIFRIVFEKESKGFKVSDANDFYSQMIICPLLGNTFGNTIQTSLKRVEFYDQCLFTHSSEEKVFITGDDLHVSRLKKIHSETPRKNSLSLRNGFEVAIKWVIYVNMRFIT